MKADLLIMDDAPEPDWITCRLTLDGHTYLNQMYIKRDTNSAIRLACAFKLFSDYIKWCEDSRMDGSMSAKEVKSA